ncbi:MAG: acyl-CoA thioesterase [Candidatus Marinimicrobia bacterium]|jgi:acyl-CoA thioester hydrolase|nr:acyl-CoA thioesterase [Candidatus Neomarinimicrobiota bacterium]MBT3501464.1 acyl-CoA thioesterase [Candidatus Neomarinimicrobiota bacterium]MBT3839397.1 acyl-CoA thioesterase [Candidatus Neomarinimicrobiota bacterium]MBT3998888.1 acyl-CoA thioesterase [Candidatus Neomarinimicrobiota bacterium]MBT4283090.1 acyl-CoA thioesterase [Candidatus Neomarinimicrobiota bacterium]
MIKYSHPVKVYYKDIDQMGIVYYSRYFEFFEEARTEMLLSIGLDYAKVEDQGAMLPVIEAHAEYKKGAIFGQNIIIHTQIDELPKVRMKFKYSVVSENTDELLMTGHTVHAFTDLKGRPIRIPKYIYSILKDKMNVNKLL